ncbi:right-handed parallel beta-helix repeat-containing protein [Haliangium sp.]|uniref:right-handed parallel beta-helix repeat-containing protein n=1 Tax=Haliangium sp. TaxID=2663208 RepID=UPI003D0C0776
MRITGTRPLFWLLVLTAAVASASCIIHAPSGPQPGPGPAPEPVEPVEPGDPGDPDDPGLTPYPPVSCTGNDDLTLDGVYIEASENGIEILGNCDVVITNSEVRAGGDAIHITGNGSVRVENCVIDGGRTSVSIRGNGDVIATGSRFFGPREVVGNGDIQDDGTNSWE